MSDPGRIQGTVPLPTPPGQPDRVAILDLPWPFTPEDILTIQAVLTIQIALPEAVVRRAEHDDPARRRGPR